MGAEAAVGQFFASWVGFLLITISSATVSVIFPKVGLPLITGYMFFGVIVGPQILNLVTSTDLPNLSYITQVALAFISLSAGSELYLPELKALFRRILSMTTITSAITFVVTTLAIWGLANGGLIPFMAALDNQGCELSISLLGASIMVTQSPSSAIAVVKEIRAKGPFTSTMLGVVVLTDVLVLLVYSIASSIANATCNPLADGFQAIELLLTLLFIALAIGFGWIMGKLIIFLIWLPRIPGEWLILPLGFLVFQGSDYLLHWTTVNWSHGINFDPLLICIAAGYVVSNQSRNRRKFLRFLGKAGPLVFIPFFTLTGATLKLKVIFQAIPFAMIMFITRSVCFIAGTWIGGKRTGVPKLQRQTMWLSLLTQAGVSLGIVAEVAHAFPEWGSHFASTMISVIVINQIVGPIACGWSLKKNDEAGKAVMDEEEEENHVNQCLIIGVNHDSLGLGQRLLQAGWNLVYLDVDETKFDLLSYLHVPERRNSHDAAAPVSPSFSAAQGHTAQVPEASLSEKESLNSHEGEGQLMPPSAVPSESTEAIQALREQRIRTRVIKPFINDTSSEDKLHQALSLGVEAVTTDITGKNTNCAVLMLDSDSEMFALCNLLLEKIHLTKVIVQVRNPHWASMFASIGVFALFPFSSNVSLLFQACVTHHGQHLEIVNPTAPLHVSLASLVKPDTAEEIPLNQFGSTPEEHAEFLRLYPDPPLPHDQLWQFNEKLKVVSQAAREEYVNQIYGAHKNQVNLGTMKAVRQGKSAFMGPAMMDDEEEEKEEELKLDEIEQETEDSQLR